jgi:SAM-dependent methyltransferase
MKGAAMADNEVEAHYSRGDLYEVITDALTAAGKDMAHLRPGDLDPVEHFHGRGVQATADLAAALAPTASDEILDIGCGVGGPARYFARTYGCQVVGIDLTAEFCEVARRLSQDVGLSDNIQIEQASATNLPFAAGRFDGAYSQNVSMNIADKAAFFGEAYRVLRPGAALALSELSQGDGGAVVYPTPWSEDGVHSFLLTEAQTVAGLEAAGFKVVSVKDNGPAMRQFFQDQRAVVARDGAPKLGPFLLMGANAKEKGRNAARNQEEGRTRAIEIICRR